MSLPRHSFTTLYKMNRISDLVLIFVFLKLTYWKSCGHNKILLTHFCFPSTWFELAPIFVKFDIRIMPSLFCYIDRDCDKCLTTHRKRRNFKVETYLVKIKKKCIISKSNIVTYIILKWVKFNMTHNEQNKVNLSFHVSF